MYDNRARGTMAKKTPASEVRLRRQEWERRPHFSGNALRPSHEQDESHVVRAKDSAARGARHVRHHRGPSHARNVFKTKTFGTLKKR